MGHKRLIVLLVLILNITTSVCTNPNDWSCGFSDHDTLRLYKLFNESCAKYRAPINFCCARHKDCYKLKLGKRNCDSSLCLCVQKYSENNDGCGPAIVRSCKDARMYGHSAYEDTQLVASINATKTPEIAMKGKRARLFRTVAEECTDVPSSIKACADNFNLCTKEASGSVCHKYIVDCSTCGAKIQNSSLCELALAKLRGSSGTSRKSSEWSRSQKLMIWMTFAEIMLLIISTGLAIVIPIGRRYQRMSVRPAESNRVDSMWKRSSDDIITKSRSVDVLGGSAESHDNLKDETGTKSKATKVPLSAEVAERRLSGEPPDQYASNERLKEDIRADLGGVVPKGGSIETAEKIGSVESVEQKPLKGKGKKDKKPKKKKDKDLKKKKGKGKQKDTKTRGTGGKVEEGETLP